MLATAVYFRAAGREALLRSEQASGQQSRTSRAAAASAAGEGDVSRPEASWQGEHTAVCEKG